MIDKMMFIGEVAKQIGLNPKTIRYYEEIDLLSKSKRRENNYRVYDNETVKRLNFIKKAQSLGFTLREIKEILTLRDRGFTPCNHVQDLLKLRITDLDQKLAELTTLRRELKKLKDEWKKMNSVEDERGEGICPQIEKVVTRLTKKPSKPFHPRKR